MSEASAMRCSVAWFLAHCNDDTWLGGLPMMDVAPDVIAVLLCSENSAQ